jgi:hypothetical protein
VTGSLLLVFFLFVAAKKRVNLHPAIATFFLLFFLVFSTILSGERFQLKFKGCPRGQKPRQIRRGAPANG